MSQPVNIHKDCFCYQTGDKQTVSLVEFPQGETGALRLTSHRILFVLEGAVRYTITGEAAVGVVVRAGEFIFLPIGTNLLYEAIENTSVMRVRLNNLIGKLPECSTFRFQRLSEQSGFGPAGNEEIYRLRVNDRIQHFIEGVKATECDGLKCSTYATHLLGQLLTLIQVYYPQEEYMRFYSTVASCDVVFSDLVYERWMDYRTVSALSLSFNMTPQQFTQRFRKVFGELPGPWLQKRRSERIYHDICSSHKSLKSIAAEHHLTMANFIRYCRMNFNATPGTIRESLLSVRKIETTETPETNDNDDTETILDEAESTSSMTTALI